MYIEYRLASERSVWRPLIINRTEDYILAEDLNAILCKESNINYSNKIDICLSIFKNDQHENIENEHEEYLKGDEKIYNGTRILVHRKIKQKILVSDICHDAKKEILLNKERDTDGDTKFLLPTEFLCKLCNLLLNESYIIVCSNNCGYSVCKSCVLFYIFSKMIMENEKKTNFVDLSLLNQKIACPLCTGFLKYCILNKKLELTLQTLREERKDVDIYNINVEEINNKFYRIVENLKIENFDYSIGNIFDTDILKKIEKKFIHVNVDSSEGNVHDKFSGGIKSTINEDVHFNIGRNEDDEKSKNEKLNEQKQKQEAGLNSFVPVPADQSNIFNLFVYLLESNKLNCIKEYELIYVDFGSVIYDSIKRISAISSQKRHVKNENIRNGVKGEVMETENEVMEKTHSIQENKTLEQSLDNGEGEKEREKEKENTNENRNENEQTNLSNLSIEELHFNNNKIYFMPLSFVGGETSYSLIGILHIKELFVTSEKVRETESESNYGNGTSQNVEDEKKQVAEQFLKKWFSNDQNKKEENMLEKLYNGNIYKIQYIIKYEKTCFFPAKKQPLYNIIHNKRQKKKKNDLEIVVDLKKFKEIICCVHDYMQYGSRPFQEEVKKNTSINVAEEEKKHIKANEQIETNNISTDVNMNNVFCSTEVSLTQTQAQTQTQAHRILQGQIQGQGKGQENQKDVNEKKVTDYANCNNNNDTGGMSFVSNMNTASVGGRTLEEQEVQKLLEQMYGTRVAPISMHNKLDLRNPYLGYCALLPFLTKEEFDMIRDLQRISKEKYLKHLYKHVKKNNLNINIFHAAVHSIFFLNNGEQA